MKEKNPQSGSFVVCYKKEGSKQGEGTLPKNMKHTNKNALHD